jgi:hypothetical protein
MHFSKGLWEKDIISPTFQMEQRLVGVTWLFLELILNQPKFEPDVSNLSSVFGKNAKGKQIRHSQDCQGKTLNSPGLISRPVFFG